VGIVPTQLASRLTTRTERMPATKVPFFRVMDVALTSHSGPERSTLRRTAAARRYVGRASRDDNRRGRAGTDQTTIGGPVLASLSLEAVRRGAAGAN